MKRDRCAGLIRQHLASDAIVYCGIGSSRRAWEAQRAPHLAYYGSDPMGISTSMALGLALARPDRQILLICGDGDLAMSMGSLLTIVASGVENLKIVVFDNGRYETGGGQSLPAAGAYSLAAIARGAGVPYAVDLSDDAASESAILEFLSQPGLALIAVEIDDEASPYPPAPAAAQVEDRVRFMDRLASES